MSAPYVHSVPLFFMAVFILSGCGTGDVLEPDQTAPDVVAGDDSDGPPPAQNAAGIPGAVTFEIGSPVRWFAAADDGTVWLVTEAGELGWLAKETFEPALTLKSSTDKVEIIHPPPSITPTGTVVITEGVLDGDECRDQGAVHWFHPDTGDVTTRELQEAPAFPFSVTPDGLVLAPFIEYQWNYYNDPPTCIKAQPLTQKLAAYAENQGLLWTIDLDKPCGPPTIGFDHKTAYYSDRESSIVAFDYSTAGFGAKKWTTAISEPGVVQVSNPALDDDNTLYVTGSKTLVAIKGADGTILWEADVNTQSKLTGEPVITEGGAILVSGTVPGSAQGREFWALFAYDREGNFLELQQMETEHLHPAPVTQWGMTVMGTGDRLTLAGPPGGPVDLIVWRQSGGPSAFEGFDDTPPLVLDDGAVLLRYGDNEILRATLSTSGLAKSPWPRWHGSNRRDGRAP